MKVNLIALSFPIFLLVGCASVSQFGSKNGPVEMTDADKIETFDSAKDAVGLLRDNSAFPFARIEDVEVTTSTVTIKEYRNSRANIFATTEFLESRNILPSYASTEGVFTFTQSRNQISIWLADIKEIKMEHSIKYSNGDNPEAFLGNGHWARVGEGYFCEVLLDDGDVVSFCAMNADYAKRVAAGIAFLAKRSVTNDVSYPAAGCLLVDDSMVKSELIDGPFDKGGIPIGVNIKSLDGKGRNAQEIQSLLLKLGPGNHTVKYYDPDLDDIFSSETKSIFIPE